MNNFKSEQRFKIWQETLANCLFELCINLLFSKIMPFLGLISKSEWEIEKSTFIQSMVKVKVA